MSVSTIPIFNGTSLDLAFTTAVQHLLRAVGQAGELQFINHSREDALTRPGPLIAWADDGAMLASLFAGRRGLIALGLDRTDLFTLVTHNNWAAAINRDAIRDWHDGRAVGAYAVVARCDLLEGYDTRRRLRDNSDYAVIDVSSDLPLACARIAIWCAALFAS